MTGNYSITYVDNTTSTINPAALTVTASQVTKTYDGTLSASGSGVVSALAGAAAGDVVNSSGSQAFLDKNAGTSNKTVRASGVTIKDATNTNMTGNYSITYVDNTISTINRKDFYITNGITAADKIYDGTTIANLNTNSVTSSGLVAGDNITGAAATGNFINKDVGTKAINISNIYLLGADAANYTVSVTQPYIFATINKANATVTADSLTTTYNGATQFILSNNFSALGLVNGETKSVLTNITASGQGINTGTYTTTASGVDNNYTINFIPGTLRINPKPLNTLVTKTYDGSATFNNGFVLSGTVPGENTPTATGSAAVSSQNAGLYSAFSTNGLTLNNSNYTLSGGLVSATISQKPLNTLVTKTYDGNATFNNGFVLSGAVTGETTPTAVGSATVSSQNTGLYSAFSTNGLTLNNSNYTLSGGLVSATISQKPLNTLVTKTYDGNATFNNGFVLSGTVPGENTPTATGSAAVSSQNAGLYSAFSTNGLTLNNSNYTLSGGLVSATISQKPLNTLVTKTYDGNATFNNGFVLSGTVPGENTPTATGSAAVSSQNAGLYSAFSTNGLTLNNSNYTLSGGLVSATISQKPLNTLVTKTYDGNATFNNGFVLSGAVTGETTPTAVGSATVSSQNAGLYSAFSTNGLTLNNSNYTLSGGLVSASINKANATVMGLSGSTEFDGITKTLTGFTATGLVNNETTGDIARSANNPNGISASTSGRFSGTYLNTPYGTANNYNLSFVSGQLVITGCPGGPPCTPIGPQTTASNITPVVIPAMTAPSFSSAVVSTTAPTNSAAPVLAFASSSGGGSFVSGGGLSTLANGNAPTNSSNTVNLNSSGNTNTSLNLSTTTTTIVNTGANPATNNTTTVSANTSNNSNNLTLQATTSASPSPTNIAGTPTTNAARPQPATGVVAINNPNATPINVTTTQPNVVNPQRLDDILNKKDPVEIATALPPTQVAQLSPEQVAPLVNSLNLRQLMSLTNEQIAKFDPARQAELLNIIKVIKDNPEKAADKAFTPTDKAFAQLAANGLLKEQIDTLSTRVTQINQNRTNVNIDTPQKLAELLTKKDPVEIATALPSNQVAQLTPEQAAPLISSLTVRQLLALTNEQISKFEPARQTELLNIINVIKNNPEKVADKAYTAIDKTTAQYVANGLMKEQIDALASKVTQITQNKTTITFDGPQKLADILNNNTPVEVAKALPSNLVPQLSSDQVAPLINAMSVKQLLSLTNEQMSRLDPARLADLLNILKGLKDNPEKATDKTYTPEDTAVAKYAATGLLKDPIERLSLRANFIADNKFKDPLSKELADLTNPPAPANAPAARNTPNQANRPLTAAQLAAQNANSETPNLTPAQVAALNPKELGPLLSKLNANQLMGITNAQMAGLEGAYLNQLTVLLNFVQDKVANPIANAGPIAPGNRVNNTNLFINQPVAKIAAAALLTEQPNTATPTAPLPAPPTQLASVTLTPKQVSELDPAQLAPLINQLNANQLMAITNAQMARMDGRALNQLTILMNFVQQRAANNNGPANVNNPAGTNTNINVFVNQPVSRLASNALLNEQPKPNAPAGSQNLTQTNITVNLTPKQVSELDPTQLAPLISQLNANQLMAITNTQMARLDTQSINQLNILMNFVQQRALNSNTSTTIYINQPVSRIAAASLMNDQPLPSQVAGAAPAPIATVPLSPQQISNLTPNQVAPLLNRMNSRQLMAVTDTQMASLDSANLNQLITLLNFIQDSARTSPIVTNNFATRPVASFLPPELNTTQTVTQP
jgi:hypothetical protein